MITIIAIGTVFNDDSIALLSLQAIEKKLERLSTDIRVVYCDSPATQLIHYLKAANEVCIVDAVVSEGEAGMIVSLSMNQLLQTSQGLSSHDLSVAAILKLAENLSCLPAMLWLLGITVNQNMTFDDQQIENIKDSLCEKIAGLVEERAALT